MKEKFEHEQNTGKRGWSEEQQSFLTHRGKVEKKAPRHYNVSRKKDCDSGTVLEEPFASPEKFDERNKHQKEEGEMVFIFNENKSLAGDKKFMSLVNEFMNKHPDIEDMPIDLNSVRIPKKYADNFMTFLAENDIELENDYDAFDAEIAIDKLGKIVDKVQSKRKPQAVARDNSKTAKNVGDKEDADDLLSWIKEPGKSDLEDVDTEE